MSSAARAELTAVQHRAHTRYLVGRVIGRTLLYVVILAGCGLYLFPFLWMVSTSLKSLDQVYQWPPVWMPNPITFSNYADAWAELPFATFYRNTLFVVATCIVGSILSCTIVAFGFARLRFRGRNFLFLVLLSTMMLPGQVTMIPLYIWYAKLGWVDTYRPMTVPSFFGSAFHIFLLRQFFLTIPHELDDAAKIDGCGYLRTLYSIILPLALPAIGVVAIFNFNTHWSEFLTPLIYLQRLEKYTIAIGLRLFQTRENTDMPWLMAMAVVALMPQVIIFFLAQRQLVQGVVLTGIKG